jgi:hypothetical protein
MRSPHPPALTLRTPALPGFCVSGDAKNADFESFDASRSDHSNPSLSTALHPSALAPPNLSRLMAARMITPFERVQMESRVELRRAAGMPHRPHRRRLFERVQIESPGPEVFRVGIQQPSSHSFERVQTRTVCKEVLASRSIHLPFERVQMRRVRNDFSAQPRPPHSSPRRNPAAADARPSSTPTTQEENPMHPLK